MPPLARNYSRDRSLIYSVGRGDFFLSSSIFSDADNFSIGQFSPRTLITNRSSSVIVLVEIIAGWRFPCEVVQRAVSSVAVQMRALHTARSWAFECPQHEKMHEKCFISSNFRQADLRITVGAMARQGAHTFNHFAFATIAGIARSFLASYPAKIAHRVKALVSGNWQPFLFLHKESPIMCKYTNMWAV